MNPEKSTVQYVRIVYKTPQFEAFYSALPAKTQTKFDYVINIISTIYNVPASAQGAIFFVKRCVGCCKSG